MRGIFRETMLELLDRKVLYLYALVTLVAMAAFYYGSEFQTKIQIQTDGEMMGGELSQLISGLAVRYLGGYISFLVFLSVMASAGIIPTMLERGRADFYLAKPISRQTLMGFKLLSIWLVYGGTVFIGGALTYLVMVIATGEFSFEVFYLLGMSLVSLLIWLSVTTLAGVLFRSITMAITAAFIVWAAQNILAMHEGITQWIDSETIVNLVTSLYYIFPKTSAVGTIALTLATGGDVGDWMPLWSSAIFAGAMFSLAVWAFGRKNY